MPTAELLHPWAITPRHLGACRYYLPENLPSVEAVACEREMTHFLHHNELALALGVAEAMGDCCCAPSAFWRELQLAAESMGLAKEAARYATHHET